MKATLWFASFVFLMVAFGLDNHYPIYISIALAIAAYRTKGDSKSNEIEKKADSQPSAKQLKSIAELRCQALAGRSRHKPLLAVYLGGTGIQLAPGTTVFLATGENQFIISKAVENFETEIAINAIKNIEITGPGTQTTNLGLTGGGFGLEGAAKGIVAATLINAATTKSTTNTFLRIATQTEEALFHFNDQEPSALRLTLSRLFLAAEANKSTPASATPSLADELTKLQSLKEAGIITEDEFSSAKVKLLA